MGQKVAFRHNLQTVKEIGQKAAFRHNVQTVKEIGQKSSVWTLCPNGTESEEIMLRNIRRFYWKQRDRGQGRKTVMAVLVFFMFVAIIVAAIIKSMMGGHHAGLETVHKTNTATGAAVVTETASGASVTATETAPDQETQEAISVDTTNLNTFLGFMSDTAYEDLKNQLIQICQDRKCRSVKKLTYQQTKAFDVTSFVLLSDGSVYQCNYNLKSCQMSLSETSYDEAAVNQMKEKELQEEQAKLEQQQKAEREKLAKKKAVHNKKKAKKKPHKTKKDKKKSSKVSSGRKHKK